jgi:hypothetical protein
MIALRSSFILLTSLALVSGGAARAANSATSGQPQEETAGGATQYGSINGRVVGEDGPVPFASVTVSPAGGRGRGDTSRNVTADAEGNFKVDGLRPIAWRVTATSPGYVSDTPINQDSQPSFHRIGESVTIRMIKGGVITGRVINASGEPQIGVRVTAQAVGLAPGAPGPGMSIGGDFQTDDRGVYRLYGLPAGSYVVVASPSSNFPNFRPGMSRSPYDGDVPIYHPSSPRDAAAEVVVNSGVETSGVDIQYRSEKGRSVSGSVSTPGAENERFGGFISVTLTHAATGALINQAFVTPRRQSGPGNNSSANAFAVYGVPDGEYELTAYRNSPEGGDASSAARRVVVNGGDVTGVELMLKPLASISGRLQLEAAKSCESPRKPFFAEQVFTLGAEDASEPKSASPVSRSSVPDRQGELLFRELQAGRYRIAPQMLDEKWFIRSITIPGTPTGGSRGSVKSSTIDVGRNGVSLKAGARLTGLTITVAEGAAAIKGKVRAVEGANLPSSLVIYLTPAESEKADDVLRYRETRANDEREFSLINLAPGKYWILARPGPADQSKPKAWNAADRIKLRKEAEATNNLIELQPCQRLENHEVVFKNSPAH